MSEVEHRVLAIVRELVAELGGSTRMTATLDARLDRDLGLSSLERVELVLRLDQEFGVQLPERVLAEAATPRDLAVAVQEAAPQEHPLIASPRSTRTAVPAAVPESARTLTEAFVWHAERTPDRVHVHLRDDEGVDRPLTYGALLARASAVAGGLRGRGVTIDEPVILMLRSEEAFFAAFLGVWMAGGIPVPIYPPVRPDQLAEYARRQRTIVTDAGARVLVTFPEAERLGTVIRGQASTLEMIVTVGGLASEGGAGTVAMGQPEAGALIQYTSGSTGSPKGVFLTHGNLLANVRAIGEGLAVGPSDVGVSWLPLYHDMGLIGAWLTPLYYGVPVAIMSPLAFLARPSRWLWAIHQHRGTVSPAPNFAYDLAVRKVADAEIEGLDLSSWRLALNGSEMVSPDTIARFTERFAPYGFRPESMCPVYGLAEASVGLTMTPLGRLPRVERIERRPFEDRRELRPASDSSVQPLRFVSCGRPLPGLEVRVVDPSGRTADDREEGRIEFRGASVTQGYYRNPAATAAARHGDWMTSGDLGYWAGGDLFITGREKDIIIQGGRNISAPEVEAIVGEVPGVRRGCVAAFGVHEPDLGTERLVVVAETKEKRDQALGVLRQAVVERVVLELGVPPDTVVLAPPGSVLKTSSGKVRRTATRAAYVSHSLGKRDTRLSQAAALLGAVAVDRARQSWRIVRDALFTARVGVSVLATAPFLWTALRLAPRGPGAIRATRRWARAMFALCGVTVDVKGADSLRTLSGGLLIANHSSYVDPLVLMVALPVELHFVAKRGLVDYPLLGLAIKKAGHLTIERGNLARRLEGAGDLVTRVSTDEFLVVFPEGTFQRRRGLLPFRLGAFKAAVDGNRTIVPVAIRGTRDLLREGTWLFRRSPLSVTIGEPLRPRAEGLQEIVRLRDEARDMIGREANEPVS
ncbi:MAG: AMP-binding protein [Vicinamibacterales bacterium]